MEPLNIVALTISYLEGVLDGIPVFADVPEKRPARFVTVERTGGPRDSIIIDRPTLAIQCWAITTLGADNLARKVDGLLPGLLGVQGITKVKRNSFYNFPDLQAKHPRYQIVVDITTTH